MSILFDTRSSTRPLGRSTTGLWLSVASHALVIGLIVVTIGAPKIPTTPAMRSARLVFMAKSATLPLVPVATKRTPAPLAPPPMRERARADVPEPPPVVPIVRKPIEPGTAPFVHATAPPIERTVEKAEMPRPETGLFERTSSSQPTRAAAAVRTGGFESTAASPRVTARGLGEVTTGGFGSGASTPRGAATGPGDVQAAGFDRQASAPVQPSVTALTRPSNRPVEIVFKPTPEYTDEARTARIEGTVSLELEFTAAGSVRVLRVVRGLGHGLDEAAQRAALLIRFTPAQSDDRPVDSRATVHITFRLS